LKKFNKLKQFFPLLKYYFTTDSHSYTEFANAILRRAFDFDTISRPSILAIFSIFSPTPEYDRLAGILKLNSYFLEVPQLMATLMF
jgi:hypothetical protein